ncbi:hypothetical protein J7L05_08540 [bacterium]|nr:hypothetical protein [bacterium]
MKIPNNSRRNISPVQRFVVIILLAVLILVPGAFTPKPAEAIGVVAVIGIASTVMTILDCATKVYKQSQGSTFCRINQAATQKTVWADIGDVIQVPIDIEFGFSNAWSISNDEWIYFEYLVFYDGELMYQERIPETGYAAKDEDCYVHVQNQLLMGMDEWECGGFNSHNLKIVAAVYDDGYFKLNNSGPTWQNHAYFQNTSLWDSTPRYRWINVNADASANTEIIVINPYWGDDFHIINRMDHTGPVGTVYLKLKIHGSHDAGGESIVTHPGTCNIYVEELPSTGGWIWEFEPSNPFPLGDHEVKDVVFNGTHATPEHPGHTVHYRDKLNFTAKGKFNMPPKPSLTGKAKTDYESYWDSKTWETRVLYNGRKQDGRCFTATMDAYCRQPASTDTPATTPGSATTPSSGQGSYNQRTRPAVTPGSSYRGSGTIDIPDNGGGVITPGEGMWPGRYDTDGTPLDPPPTGWKPLIDPADMDDIMWDPKELDWDKFKQKVEFVDYALDCDIITGTVINDARKVDPEVPFDFRNIDGDIIVGNVVVDDYTVEPVGEPLTDPSGKYSSMEWVTMITGGAGIVSLINPGNKKTELGEITTFVPDDIPNPFLKRSIDPSPYPSERIMPEDTWVYSPKDQPEYSPEIPEDSPAFTPDGYKPPSADTAYPNPDDIYKPDMPTVYETPDPVWDDLIINPEEYLPPVVKHFPEIIKPGETVDAFGYFPKRVIDNPLVPTESGDLLGLGLGPVDKSDVNISELVKLPPLATSSIDYRCYIPTNTEPGKYEVYEILNDVTVLPTNQITTAVKLTSEGTPVLKSNERGKITLTLDAGDIEFPEDEILYLEIMNLTTNIIQFDSGTAFIVPCDLSKGKAEIEIPFTGRQVGEYSVRVDYIKPDDMMTDDEFHTFLSNNFDRGYLYAVTQDDFREIEEVAKKLER